MTEDSGLPDFAFLDALADAADAVTLPLFRTPLDVEVKRAGVGDIDPVTAADRGAEEAMRRVIAARFPGHGVAGEEFGTTNPHARHVWHLDPVDGTRQFITGMPLWGTMAGLSVDGSPTLGMMSQPFTRERFLGGPEGTRYRGPNGSGALRVRPCARLADAAFFTTDPRLYREGKRDALLRMEAAVRLVRYGTDCYAFCLVALGTADIAMEAGVQPYDIVPLVPIIEAAGGAVVDWQGRRVTGGGDVLAVGDRRLLEPALRLLAG